MEVFMFKIYIVTNKVNNKKYIGLTKRSIKYRWCQHVSSAIQRNSKFHFHCAIRKYGVSNFHIELLHDKILSESEVLKLEAEYVTLYDSYHNGYNSTPGGDHFVNSEWQRQNQLNRVASGTHPFVGGDIQRETQNRLVREGLHNFNGLNSKRIAAGTHNFIGDLNPTRELAKQGRHHNQKPAWRNTKVTHTPMAIIAWLMADELYESYKVTPNIGAIKLAKLHNLNYNIESMLNKYFRRGWVPNHDKDWLSWKNSFDTSYI